MNDRVVDVLRGALDEAQKIAEDARSGEVWPWRVAGEMGLHVSPSHAFVAWWDPSTVLRLVAATRWLLDEIIGELADDAEQVMVNDRLDQLVLAWCPDYSAEGGTSNV